MKVFKEECSIFNELDSMEKDYFFYKKDKKYLHNVDTFYYSVKLANDFTQTSIDVDVKRLRDYFNKQKQGLDSRSEFKQVYINNYLYNLTPLTFAGMYTIHLQIKDKYDIFIAPTVPSSESGESVTSEILVQIRSYDLWLLGYAKAFESSYKYIKNICDYFNLSITSVNENRIDYCWHTNYLDNPEKFFTLDNLFKMRVDRFKGVTLHADKVGSDDYEIDYLAMGKRSDKIFLRMYLKSKEVVEQGYKPWFFMIWLFNGLISRYDFYVYDICFKKRNWAYLNRARLEFYIEYGSNTELIDKAKELLNSDIPSNSDTIRKFVNEITPRPTLILNVEYQVMRRHSKSYCLLPIKDNAAYGECKRIYDLLDNHSLITDYLTSRVFRLVRTDMIDKNKSRRDDVEFWKRLRITKLVDVKRLKKDLKLIREYTTNITGQMTVKRALHSITNYSLVTRGKNNDTFIDDVVHFISSLNDNDIKGLVDYKSKKSNKLNFDKLITSNEINRKFAIFNYETGEFIE